MSRNQLLTLIASFIVSSALSQSTYSWIGPNNGSWAISGNWSPTRTSPATNDILQFNDGTTKTITNVPTQTIGRLSVSANTNVTLNAASSNRTVTIGNITGDDLVIQSGSSLTIGAGTNFIISVTNNATASIGGTLNITNGRTYATNTAGTVTTVTATGRIDNSGTVNSTSTARLSFLSGATYMHDQNGGTIPTATWNASSNNDITGITNTAPAGLNQSFGNLTWDCAGQTSTVQLANNLTSVAGNLLINNSSREVVALASNNGTTYTLAIAGDFTVNDDCWLSITDGDNITATVNVGGNFSFTGATNSSSYFDYHIASGGGTTLGKIIMNVTGNFSQSGGLFDFAYGSSNTANFTELRVAGNFALTGPARMITSTTDNSISNGAITFNKAGMQTVSVAASSSLSFTNFIIANNSITRLLSDLSLTSSLTSVWGGVFTVNSGGTADLGTSQILNSTGLVLGFNNAFILNAGAKVITANNNGLESLGLGSVSTFIATRTYSSGADYEFQGTNTGLYLTSPSLLTVRDLIINNPSSNVILSQATTITRDLKLLDGELTTTLLTLVTINDNATASSYSNQSFVVGPILKRGNDDFTFPTGRTGSGLVPIRLSGLSASSDFLATYSRLSALTLGLITAPGLFRISYCEYWNLTRVGAATANVTMYWNPQSNCNAASYVTNLSSIVVSRFNTISWDGFGRTGGTTGTISNGSVTWNNVNVFNSFALGSNSAISNPLPILLDNVKAIEKNNGVEVQWSNLTEKDVSEYSVQHSVDAASFTDISTQLPTSNQDDRADYTSFDPNPVRGVNYYRIKAREIAGRVIYSKILRVEIGSDRQIISLYPNPVTGKQLTIGLTGIKKGNYSLNIINNSGQHVYKTILQSQGETITQGLQLPASMSNGVYTILISSPDYVDRKTFIVQ